MPFIKIHYPILEDFLEAQRAKAAESPRRRAMHVVVGGPDEPVQALLNTFMQDSYAQPHKHGVDETFECIDGTFRLVAFNEDGTPWKMWTMQQGSTFRVPAGMWHTAFCVSENGTIFETKDGRYDAEKDKVFAEWAPAENEPAAAGFLESLRNHA